MNIQKLTKYLQNEDACDKNIDIQRLASSGWKNPKAPSGDPQYHSHVVYPTFPLPKGPIVSPEKSLAKHDKQFHPNGYKEGDTCKFRDELKKKDQADAGIPTDKVSSEKMYDAGTYDDGLTEILERFHATVPKSDADISDMASKRRLKDLEDWGRAEGAELFKNVHDSDSYEEWIQKGLENLQFWEEYDQDKWRDMN